MIRIRITKNTAELYALVLLHLPSPLALGAVQVDHIALEGCVLSRVKSQPAQRGVPADRTIDGVHRQRAGKKACGVCVRLGRRLGWVFERRLGGKGRGCAVCLRWCRIEGERS